MYLYCNYDCIPSLLMAHSSQASKSKEYNNELLLI